MTKTQPLVLVAAALGFATTAHAHFIWLEPAGGAAVLRFGEYGQNLREVSPGRLDRFGKPSASLVSAQGEKTAELSKTVSGFTLPFAARQGESIVAEDAHFPLRKSKQGECAGEKYDLVNYVTSVTYVKAGGPAPLPAGPAGVPSN